MTNLSPDLNSLSPDQIQLLVQRLAQKKAAPERRQLVPAPREGGFAELSFAQERLWILEQLTPGLALYNMSGAGHVVGPLDPQLWDRILNEVIRRHEVLRSTFDVIEGHPRALILPELTVQSTVVDLRHNHAADPLPLLRAEACRPFNLNTGPLIRSTIFQVGDRECYVLLTMHHIVSDGLSTTILFEECGAIYPAFVAGRKPHLPELEVQYADYAYWQRRWLDQKTLDTQKSYWVQQLEGVSPVLELPADRRRIASATSPGQRHPVRLGSRLTDALRELSRKEGVTLFMTLLAGFGTVLSRYSRQADFAIGTPVAGRQNPQLQKLIGCFLNTLALRMDLQGDVTFRELLQRVRKTVLGALAHQDLPFEKVIEALHLERTSNVSPLFQVMFSLESSPMANNELPGLSIRFEEVETGTSKVDLTLELTEHRGELTGWLEFNSNLFNRSTIARFSSHMEMVLEQMARDPDQRAGEVRLMKRVELVRTIHEWNDTDAEYPTDASVHQMFEAQVLKTPGNVAVRYGKNELSYLELNFRANRVARLLRLSGVREGQLVAMCLDRSAELIIGTLAILKSGAAYVPLDVGYPRERVEFMLADTRVEVLLTTRDLLRRLPAFAGRTVCLDEVDADSLNGENLDIDVRAEDLAYVMFTSGSTGRPKGIGIPHRAINRLVLNSNYVRFQEDDRLAQVSNVCFDASTFEIWGALLSGASLVGINKDVALSPLDFARQLREQGITTMFLTTALFNRLAVEVPGAFEGLRHLLVGGDILDPDSARQVLSGPGRPQRLLNVYGPTESTTFASWHEFQNVAEDAVAVPIGKPLANTQLYVLDAGMELVPVGVSGELFIGGDGLAHGYLGRPDLTAKMFLPDPFAEKRGARLYRTGDLARYAEDGAIEFLGRNDNQVKIRGFRIEPGEIEAVLRTHPQVRECAVILREDVPGHKRLVAYIATSPDGISGIRAYSCERMPDYMVPAAWVALPELPLNPNGKIDRGALPAPDDERPEQNSAYLAPRNAIEAQIAGIWSSVLGIKRIGVNDNFFELGGDSILAIQVAARCNQAGLAVTPGQTIQHQTVAALATVAGRSAAPALSQEPVTGAVPLTPIQCWFFEQNLVDAHHWNQAVMLELRQIISPNMVKTAIQALISHHDALRLRFHAVNGEWRQEIVAVHPDDDAPFVVEELSAVDQESRKLAIEQRAGELQATLHLGEGPLLRAAYFDLGSETNARLMIAVHHLAVDGVSWRILLEDLQTALNQQLRGEEIRLPLKTTSFQAWSEHLREYSRDGSLESQFPYWTSQCEADNGVLHTDFPFTPGQNTCQTAEIVNCGLTAEETSSLLHKAPSAYRTHGDELLLAALALAFARQSNRHSLLIELEGHGREEIPGVAADLSRTVGWFTTVSPLYLQLDEADPGIAKAIKMVKEQVRQRPRHGFEFGILRYLSGKLQSSASPQLSFNYLGQFDAQLDQATAFRMAKESPGRVFSPRGERRRLIEVNGMVIGGEMRFEWIYSTAAYKRSTLEALAARFIEELRGVIAHCLKPDAAGFTPSDFPLARLNERKLNRVASLLSRSGQKNRSAIQ